MSGCGASKLVFNENVRNLFVKYMFVIGWHPTISFMPCSVIEVKYSAGRHAAFAATHNIYRYQHLLIAFQNTI